MPPTDPRGLELFEITTALAIAIVCGWAAWGIIKPFVEAWRHRRLERRIWREHQARCEAERLGLGGDLFREPTYLRRHRRAGRR